MQRLFITTQPLAASINSVDASRILPTWMNSRRLKSPKRAERNYSAPQVIDERNAFIMDSMLRDVIKRGTGRRARSLGRDDLAGKTGTTNDAEDTWFNG